MEKEKSFLGVGWAFPPAFTYSSHQSEMVSAEKDIHQSLMILLGTTPGERVMHPKFGCGIHKLVYEPISNSLFTKIKDLVEKAILLFESRIILHDVIVEHNPKVDGVIYISHDVIVEHNPKVDGVIYISLDYTIRAVNTRQNLVYPFYLLEGTNVKTIE